MLTELERLPPGLADCPAAGLAELLGGPTLLHLPGRRGRPLFLTVLQHTTRPPAGRRCAASCATSRTPSCRGR